MENSHETYQERLWVIQKRIRNTNIIYELTMLSCQSLESMREEKYHIGSADSAERVER